MSDWLEVHHTTLVPLSLTRLRNYRSVIIYVFVSLNVIVSLLKIHGKQLFTYPLIFTYNAYLEWIHCFRKVSSILNKEVFGFFRIFILNIILERNLFGLQIAMTWNYDICHRRHCSFFYDDLVLYEVNWFEKLNYSIPIRRYLISKSSHILSQEINLFL